MLRFPLMENDATLTGLIFIIIIISIIIIVIIIIITISLVEVG